MKHTKKCRRCWWAMLKNEQAMAAWLAEVLGAQMQYQWCLRDDQGREEPRAFHYQHPNAYQQWLEHGPCKGCPCERHCDQICTLRANWWDARMKLVRSRCGM